MCIVVYAEIFTSFDAFFASPEATTITTIPCLSRRSGIRANNVLLLASPIRSLSCSLTSCAPTASNSLQLKRRVVQAAKEHLVARQSLELLRLHFLRLVLRIREGLYNALHARRRWYFAIGQAKSFDAFLHLSGFWLPPLSSISEFHLAAGELACCLVAADTDSSDGARQRRQVSTAPPHACAFVHRWSDGSHGERARRSRV